MTEDAGEALRNKLSGFPHLTKGEIQRIETSKQELDQGNFLTNSQADKLVDEWLKV